MKKSNLGQMECSLARALVQVGDAWTLLILKEIMLGNRRYDGIHKQTGMSSVSLASRLLTLEAARIVQRVAYSERPRRFEYRVTEKGESLWPVLVALTQWGDEWANDRRGDPPLKISHKDCVHEGRPVFCCSACGETLTARDSAAVISKRMKKDRDARESLAE